MSSALVKFIPEIRDSIELDGVFWEVAHVDCSSDGNVDDKTIVVLTRVDQELKMALGVIREKLLAQALPVKLNGQI